MEVNYASLKAGGSFHGSCGSCGSFHESYQWKLPWYFHGNANGAFHGSFRGAVFTSVGFHQLSSTPTYSRNLHFHHLPLTSIRLDLLTLTYIRCPCGSGGAGDSMASSYTVQDRARQSSNSGNARRSPKLTSASIKKASCVGRGPKEDMVILHVTLGTHGVPERCSPAACEGSASFWLRHLSSLPASQEAAASAYLADETCSRTSISGQLYFKKADLNRRSAIMFRLLGMQKQRPPGRQEGWTE